MLVVEELLRALSARGTVKTIWQVGLFSNLRLFVVVASFAMQLAILYLPALQTLFGTAAISPRQYAAWLALEAVPLMVLELMNRIPYRGAGLAVVLAVDLVGGVAAQ